MLRTIAIATALASLALPALADGPRADWPEWKKKLWPETDDWRNTKQVLTFVNGAEPETLDPHIMTGVPEHRLATALFEGLVTQHPQTLEPVPGVAERWEVSPDGITYTFHLRKDAKWSDGKPLTTRDFVESWKRALLPETASQYAYMLYPIAGAEAFNKGPNKGKEWDKVGVAAKDDHTLVVTLASPCAYFLDLAAFETLMPVPMEVVAKHGDRWSRAENIVCNGPFKVKEWSPRQKIVFEKNPHYWDRDFVKLEQVVALPFEDLETAYKLFQQGQCDWNTAVPAAKILEIKRLPEYYAFPYLGSYFYRVNVTKPPLDDVRVRKALSLALDREVITRDVLKAGQIPATWFCPALPGYEPPKGLAADRQAARKLLAEAGYGPGGKPFPPLELLYNTNEAHKQVAEVLVQQWKEALGISVSLRNTEWKVYLNDVQNLAYNVARAGWIGDYTDPNTFLDMFVTGGGNNQTGWSNARYDQLIADAAKEVDRAKRAALLQQAEKILVEEELPIIPIYIYVNQGLIRDTVMGWYENVRDQHPFQYIWMESAE